MLLVEITSKLNKESIITLVKAVDDATGNDGGDKNAQLFLFNNLKNPEFSQFLYRGPMFRVLVKSGKRPITTEQVMSWRKSTGQTSHSFAKTKDGVDAFTNSLGEISSKGETHTILKQTGVGFDVQKQYRYIKQFSETDLKSAGIAGSVYNLQRAGGTFPKNQTLTQFETVREVIGPYNNSLSIVSCKYFSYGGNVHIDFLKDKKV